MRIEVEYKFWESYLPSNRHRKLRYREISDSTTVTILEVTHNDAPVAFRVHEILKDEPTEYRLFNSELWKPLLRNRRVSRAEGLYSVDELINALKYHGYYKHLKSKDEAEQEKHDFASRHIIINGIVYEEAGEPRYVINTFGLGHNHGGTGMFVEEWYNSNITHKRYFNALDREAAISEANRIASSRGDTNDVGRFDKVCNIEVLIPEAVRCKPSEEHGDGDPFINSLNTISEITSSANEAGLVGLAVLAKELSK